MFKYCDFVLITINKFCDNTLVPGMVCNWSGAADSFHNLFQWVTDLTITTEIGAKPRSYNRIEFHILFEGEKCGSKTSVLNLNK